MTSFIVKSVLLTAACSVGVWAVRDQFFHMTGKDAPALPWTSLSVEARGLILSLDSLDGWRLGQDVECLVNEKANLVIYPKTESEPAAVHARDRNTPIAVFTRTDRREISRSYETCRSALEQRHLRDLGNKAASKDKDNAGGAAPGAASIVVPGH